MSRLAADKRTLGYLVLAGVVAAVANGPHALAIAAWLGPFFWLRALHRMTVRTGALVGGLVHGAATVVAARGMLPMHGVWYVLAALFIGMGALFPFVVQRALAPRLPVWLIPLVLPVAASALEFLGALGQPFGSFGAVAYTQMGALALLQLAALTGLPGIALLIYLPASLAQWALDYRPPRAQLVRAVSLAALALALTFGLGTLRLEDMTGKAPLVQVAVVSSPLDRPLRALLAPAYENGDPATVNWPEALHQGEIVVADLLQRTQAAARAGARIIVWPETSGIVTLDAEPALVRAAGALTRSEGVYLAMALGVVHHRALPWPVGDGALDNKLVLLGPNGQVVSEYHKSIAVPGPEAVLLVPGSGTIPIVETPYGRLGMAICFDLDFPRFMRGAAGVDLLLAAAEDWRGIAPYHSDMARLRAIEGGYALLRATRDGFSIAADAHGRLVAAQADFGGNYPDVLLRAAIPVGSVRTVYAKVGDAVGYLTVGGLLLLVLLGLVGARRPAAILDERPIGAGDHREKP